MCVEGYGCPFHPTVLFATQSSLVPSLCEPNPVLSLSPSGVNTRTPPCHPFPNPAVTTQKFCHQKCSIPPAKTFCCSPFPYFSTSSFPNSRQFWWQGWPLAKVRSPHYPREANGRRLKPLRRPQWRAGKLLEPFIKRGAEGHCPKTHAMYRLFCPWR